MIVLLVVLADLVIEEVLFVFERLRATDVFQKELCEGGCYDVALF